jgi:5,6,7,8-tetrahydromethanopterin hydro-lyase
VTYPTVPAAVSLSIMADNVMLIGESLVGEGTEAAHVNTVPGRRDGPVGVAWATALAAR